MQIENEYKGTYKLATKYNYELPTYYNNVKIVGKIYDYRVASKFKDVISEYTRLKQLDINLVPLEDLVFLIIKNENFQIDIVAVQYLSLIEEIIVE